MAEGHSVLRWARALKPLIGKTLLAVEAPQRWSERVTALSGRHLTEIGTHGKHLLLRTSAELTVHCHAMIYGSWQFGRPGMKLRKPEKNVRLRLGTSDFEAVFFNGPVVELLTAQELREHEKLNALGPDLLHADFDREEAWRRLQRDGGRPLGDALLDQKLVAGVGNIFKSEGLFAARLDPRVPMILVDRASLERLWHVLIPMMSDSAKRSGPVVTLNSSLRRGGERYWVYRRTRRPCYRCSTPVEMIRQGQQRRTTYYCPNCQNGPVLRRL